MPQLEFLSIFAQGDSIDVNKKNDLINHISYFNQGFKKETCAVNEWAKKMKLRFPNKKDFRNLDTIQDTTHLINCFVEISTDKKCNIDGMYLKSIELLVLTMDSFFKTLLLSNMKMKHNDWFDLSILAYVGPNDKFWTEDGKLIERIKEADCDRYLFEEDKI
jgi:hypothetical protein